MKKEKMIKIANMLEIGLKIVYIISMAFGIFSFLFGLVLLGLDSRGNTEMDWMAIRILTYVKITFAPRAFMAESSIIVNLLILLQGVLCIVSSRCSYKICRQILIPLKSGRPFDNQSSKYMEKLAKLFFVFNIAAQVLGNLYLYINFHRFDLTPLISEDKITSISYWVTFDWRFLLVVGALYLLAYVFKYGEVLQQESDETL